MTKNNFVQDLPKENLLKTVFKNGEINSNYKKEMAPHV